MNEKSANYSFHEPATGLWASICDDEYHRLRRQLEFKKYMDGEARRIGIQPCQVRAGEIEISISCDTSQFIGQLEDINDRITEIREHERPVVQPPMSLTWQAALFLMLLIGLGGYLLGRMIGSF